MKYSPFSVFLRNLLVRKHFWFSCCASCGEIKTPLGKRLCASLTADFPVDAVVAGPLDEPSRQKIRAANPWLRNVIAAGAPAQAPPVILPALAHTLPGLAECFLTAKSATELAAPVHVLDFFTPNGIPFIALSRLPEPSRFSAEEPPAVGDVPSAPGLYAHTGENSELFAPVFRRMLEERGDGPKDAHALYAAALAHWAYREGRGVLAG
ncbi:MAG: hypothetical protein LBR94_05290 [Desulfovibrio sp.]|jgi:hypothetical protein|nr:hypothetical protein [Desulfovibrio sp.]